MTSTRIEAEDYVRSFDTTPGNAGVPYPESNPNSGDTDIYTTSASSGYMVGNIKPSEWLEYDFSLPQTGTYDIVARVVSTKRLSHSIDLLLGGQTYTFDFSRTGNSWEAWTDVVISNVSLEAGLQTMRLVMGSSRFNVNYIEFIPTNASPSPVPAPIPTPEPVPTPSPTPEPVPTPSPTPEPVPTPSPTPEPVPTPSPTPEPVPTPSPTPEPVPTPSPTPEPVPTPSPTPEPVPTPSPTPEPVPTPSPTPEPVPTPSPTPEPVPTPSPTPEPVPTPSPTPEPVPTPSPTPEPVPTPSPTPEPVPTPSPTPEPVPTPSPTPEPVPTPSPEPDAGAIAFSANNYSVDEDGITASLTLNRLGGSDGEVSVDITTANGTAIAPDDYTGTVQTITFADGVTSQSVSITIIDDTLDEADETINVALSNPTSGVTLGDTIQSVITILDNDEPVAPPAPTPTPNPPTPTPTPPSPSPAPTPTPSAAIRVEAEDYTDYLDTSSGNAGGVYRSDDVDIYTTTDASGYTVAGIKAGEWLEQSVTIPEAGDYILVARVASPKSLSHSLTVTIGGETNQFSFGKTGKSWESWANITIDNVTLTAGTQTLRMTMGSSKFSLNYVDIIPSDGTSPSPTPAPTPSPGPSPTPTPGPSPTPTPGPSPTPTFDLGRVMPLGDSITDGFSTFRGGYRDNLENLLTDNGIAFDFVGSLQNGPSSLSDRDHQGHSGFRIDEIANSATSWVQAQDPDIVLLLIGTNDMNQNYQVGSAPNRLSTLIDQVLDAAPQSHVVVSTIPPTTKNQVQPRVEAYNAAIPGIVATKIADGQSVSLVDNYSVLTTADLGDNLHPNQGGYDKMAEVWFDELLGFVPSDLASATLPSMNASMSATSTHMDPIDPLDTPMTVSETVALGSLRSIDALGTAPSLLPESNIFAMDSPGVEFGSSDDGVLA